MKKGDFIRIDYVARVESGEIFDITLEETAKKENIYNKDIKYKTVPVILGANFVISGLDEALLSMSVGEKKIIELKPEEAFGNRDSKLIKIIPKSTFGDRQPKQGMIVDFSGHKGRIQSVTGGRVRVDFNHPLAGKVLRYEIEIKDSITDPLEQIKSIFEFFGMPIENPEIKGSEAIAKCAEIPRELKQEISSLILEYVNPDNKKLEKVSFVESFESEK